MTYNPTTLNKLVAINSVLVAISVLFVLWFGKLPMWWIVLLYVGYALSLIEQLFIRCSYPIATKIILACDDLILWYCAYTSDSKLVWLIAVQAITQLFLR